MKIIFNSSQHVLVSVWLLIKTIWKETQKVEKKKPNWMLYDITGKESI